MIEQRRYDGAVALAFERRDRRGIEEGTRLEVGARRRLALVAVEVRALDPVHRVMRHGIFLAEIFKERRERATDITVDLLNGRTVEHAPAIAAHESPRTTKFYDRTSDEITLDEIGRIGI